MPKTSNVSGDLVWLLVKRNNAFLVKRRDGRGAQFSRERGNLSNRNTRVASGLANAAAVDVTAVGNGIQISTKSRRSGSGSRPAATWSSAVVTKSPSVPKVIRKRTAEAGRRDLKRAALARWSKLAKAAKRA